ncbi:MAG: hypothetical protein AB7G75_17475 [Candidatus Binatia bacterium]
MREEEYRAGQRDEIPLDKKNTEEENYCHKNELTVRRFTPAVIIWLLLFIVLIDIRAIAYLAKGPIVMATSAIAIPELVRPDRPDGKVFAENAASLSQEYNVKSERENKKPHLLVRRLTETHSDAEGQRVHPVPSGFVVPLSQVLFHRKISPPSTSNDPFLN